MVLNCPGDEMPDEHADENSGPESEDLPTVRIRSSNSPQAEVPNRKNVGKPSSTTNRVSACSRLRVVNEECVSDFKM